MLHDAILSLEAIPSILSPLRSHDEPSPLTSLLALHDLSGMTICPNDAPVPPHNASAHLTSLELHGISLLPLSLLTSHALSRFPLQDPLFVWVGLDGYPSGCVLFFQFFIRRLGMHPYNKKRAFASFLFYGIYDVYGIYGIL